MARTTVTVRTTDVYTETTEITEEFFEPDANQNTMVSGKEWSVTGLENVVGRYYRPVARISVSERSWGGGSGGGGNTSLSVGGALSCLMGEGTITTTTTDPLKCTDLSYGGSGSFKSYLVYFPNGQASATAYYKEETNYASGVKITVKVTVSGS